MHQIEYKAERLEAMKLQMANESRKVYDDYLVALDKTKVQMKTLTDDGSVTFRDVTNYSDFISAGYALVYDGEVYDNTTDGKRFTDLVAQVIEDHGNDTSVTAAEEIDETADKDNGGKFYSPDTDPLKFADFETSIAINTGLQEITDEIALRKAEAKYEADMKTIDQKDRKYDTDLAALDAERNAIKQEMETLKTVSKDNVERTFKLFS